MQLSRLSALMHHGRLAPRCSRGITAISWQPTKFWQHIQSNRKALSSWKILSEQTSCILKSEPVRPRNSLPALDKRKYLRALSGQYHDPDPPKGPQCNPIVRDGRAWAKAPKESLKVRRGTFRIGAQNQRHEASSTIWRAVPGIGIQAEVPHESLQNPTHISLQVTKRCRSSPAICLSLYLEGKTVLQRRTLWTELTTRGAIMGLALPTILMRYLHNTENPKEKRPSQSNAALDLQELAYLRRSKYTMDDIHNWAWILRATDPKVLTDRFLASATTSKIPDFVLLHVLQCTNIPPHSLSRLVTYCWTRLRRHTPSTQLQAQGPELAATAATPSGITRSTSDFEPSFEINVFEIIASRLLTRCRESWPTAMGSISNLIVMYLQEMENIAVSKGDPIKLVKIRARSNSMLNKFISRLAIPAVANPLRSMVYNWHAQLILLGYANDSMTPIAIDRFSYRAVGRVLAASKKSGKETTFARLMRRIWPPWRKEEDGMDVLRARDADHSRVSQSMIRMIAAGYAQEDTDRILRMVGGREPDYTPTIQTRSLLKSNRGILKPSNPMKTQALFVAARVRTTRDIREAWAAFQSLPSEVPPTSDMYLEMFEKLHAHFTLPERGHHITLPGDAKEVVPVFDDNISDNERQRTQPPSIKALYNSMIDQGVKPSGRLLEFLVAQGLDFSIGAAALMDSDLPPKVAAMLLGLIEMDSRIQKVPDRVLAAFIKLTCSLTKPFLASKSVDQQQRGSDTITIGNRAYKPIGTPLLRYQYPVLQSDPFLHAFKILKAHGTSFKPAWYALIRALAHPNAIVDRNLFGTPMNDVLAWRVIEAVLREIGAIGLWLDPLGFQLVCQGLEKGILASANVHGRKPDLDSGLAFVKATFRDMIGAVPRGANDHVGSLLPKLLYNLEGSHIHAYIRVLGIANDIHGIKEVLSWLVKHQTDLEAWAVSSNNGMKLLRRSMVAVRALTEREGFTTSKEELSALRDEMSRLGDLGAWPTDEEMKMYRAHAKEERYNM